jgi:hypothetical protein
MVNTVQVIRKWYKLYIYAYYADNLYFLNTYFN